MSRTTPLHPEPVPAVAAGEAPAQSGRAARLLAQVLAKRPLLSTESPSDYDDLLARLITTVEPADVIQEIAVKDFVDLTWEIERFKRLKAAHLADHLRRELIDALRGLRGLDNRHVIDQPTAASHARACLNGDPTAVADVTEILRQGALDLDTVTARAAFSRMEGLERIDRQIASAESRRSRHLADLERRQAVLARRLRQAAASLRLSPTDCPEAA